MNMLNSIWSTKVLPQSFLQLIIVQGIYQAEVRNQTMDEDLCYSLLSD